MNKKALIIGIAGQDGYYLSNYLLSIGYSVYGISNLVSDKLDKRIEVKILSIDNYQEVKEYILKTKPDEIYNLASQTFVPASWDNPILTLTVNTLSLANILDVIVKEGLDTKIFQASSAEIFGEPKYSPQDESHPIQPRNPYGVSKAASFELIRNYRNKYKVFACNGILYNHESPMRDYSFVTKKITTAANIIVGNLPNTLTNSFGEKIVEDDGKLHIGNIQSLRDWGHAQDYVKVMHLMLQHECSDDYVVSTGKLHSVEEFIALSFKRVGIKNWKDYIVIDERFYREKEKIELVGDNSKICKTLNWCPKYSLEDIVNDLVDNY